MCNKLQLELGMIRLILIFSLNPKLKKYGLVGSTLLKFDKISQNKIAFLFNFTIFSQLTAIIFDV